MPRALQAALVFGARMWPPTRVASSLLSDYSP